MSSVLRIGLRFAFAALGLLYVVWSLEWGDGWVLPSGWTLPDGTVLAEPTRYPAAEGRDAVLLPDGWDLPLSQPLPAEITWSPGVRTTVLAAEGHFLLWGLLLFAPMFPLAAWRWLLLLRARGFAVGAGDVFALTMVGNFFNFCLPGTVSGDVAKAWYAARGSERRLDAVATVLVDRILGLSGLALLAGLAGLALRDDPDAAPLLAGVWIGLGVLLLAAALWGSRRSRARLGRVFAWTRRLPLLQRVDQALHAYRDHGGTVATALALSVLIHLCASGATVALGYGLGMDLPLELALVVIPLLYLAAVVPLTYQGLGVMEALAFALILAPPAVTANQIVGMLMLSRLGRVLYSLIGAAYLGFGRVQLTESERPQPGS